MILLKISESMERSHPEGETICEATKARIAEGD
ncbi:MAG: hypothetical protein BWY43_00278 [candidate division WS2 bacterium ADurb.Bin280]|uniref:Uncharacterized protein n=1 Tax=candidate division WS2 bacterium ADurb.Bin280 TaxID=1852829 RepID=A0A1V5SEM1_9BACT|nr:MAG: hypothetical protein BWY43_00278 [candidate division WS2 bacterium ADurb.Bin280]